MGFISDAINVGDKVAISSRNSDHKLGIVVGYITESKPDILVKVLCGGMTHNNHTCFTVYDDDGGVVSVPYDSEFFFFSESALKVLGSTL